MKQSWLEEMHTLYIAGEAVDAAALEPEHRLPTLAGLSLAITAFSLAHNSVRDELIRQITSAEGTYKATFTSDCTHLIVGPDVPGGDDSVFAIDKVKMALMYQEKLGLDVVHVVWSEWLEDSLAMNGALNESRYSISRPRPGKDRQIGALRESELCYSAATC